MLVYTSFERNIVESLVGKMNEKGITVPCFVQMKGLSHFFVIVDPFYNKHKFVLACKDGRQFSYPISDFSLMEYNFGHYKLDIDFRNGGSVCIDVKSDFRISSL